MLEKAPNPNIIRAINEFLNGDNWKYSLDTKRGIFNFILSMDGPMNKIHFFIGVEDSDYVVMASPLVSVNVDDKETVRNMCEYVCRVNSRLKNGCFEFDMDDGDITYKTYVDCRGTVEPTKEIVENSIRCPAAMYYRYSSGFMDVIFNKHSAKEALRDESDFIIEEMLRSVGEEDEKTDRLQSFLSEIESRIDMYDPDEEELDARTDYHFRVPTNMLIEPSRTDD